MIAFVCVKMNGLWKFRTDGIVNLDGFRHPESSLGGTPCQSRLQVNPLTPNDHYSGRTAPLASKVEFYIFIEQICGTEYFKHGIYSPFFFLFKLQFVS